jgi:hypothetical protein
MNMAGIRCYAWAVTATVIAGCAIQSPQSPSQAPPPLLPAADRPDHKTAYVYVGQCCRYYNSGKITLYDLGLTGAVRMITNGDTTPNVITVDRVGRLYTINQIGGPYGVTEYDRGNANPSRRITLADAWTAATDSSNNLYVASCHSCVPYESGKSSIDVYKAGTTTLLRSITRGIDGPRSVAVDSHDNLYVANLTYSHRSAVTVYAPGASKPFRRLSEGLVGPFVVALDPSNNLFVLNEPIYHPKASVVEYQADTNKVLRTIIKGIDSPQTIAVDDSGNLYVANSPGVTRHGWISVYAPGALSPTYKITSGINHPIALAVDHDGNLYVGSDHEQNHGSVSAYAPNGQEPIRVVNYHSSHEYPLSLAVGP